MTSWDHDERLLADLRAARPDHPVGGRPTPPGYRDAALAALLIGRIEGPTGLAELVFDSACDPEPAGLTRSRGSTRLLAFRADRFTIDVEIGDDGLLGQVYPALVPAGSVHGESARGVFGEAVLDEVGGFTLPLPAPGPIRLRASVAGLTVVTSWLVLRYPTG